MSWIVMVVDKKGENRECEFIEDPSKVMDRALALLKKYDEVRIFHIESHFIMRNPKEGSE